MRIAIWLEQDESGGVSTHLITLLENWPDPDDEVFLFTNSNNPGLPEVISKSGPLSFMKIIVIGRLRSNCARRKILEVFLLGNPISGKKTGDSATNIVGAPSSSEKKTCSFSY